MVPCPSCSREMVFISIVRDANQGINYELWKCKHCSKKIYISPGKLPREYKERI